MSLKDVDLEQAFRRLAERRIEDAMREGKFDNLSGKGKPVEIEELPADENARAAWWALRIMRRNDFTPDEVRWRKALDYQHDALARAKDEAAVRAAVGRINDLVRRINTLGTNALKAPVAPVSEEAEVRRFRDRQQLQDGGATEVALRVAAGFRDLVLELGRSFKKACRGLGASPKMIIIKAVGGAPRPQQRTHARSNTFDE